MQSRFTGGGTLVSGDPLQVLGASVTRLRTLVEGLDEDTLLRPAFPAEWTVAQVLSHLGSGAVIMQRRLEGGLEGQPFPDHAASAVWNEWNAKSPRAQAEDALAADAQLLRRFNAVPSDDRASLSMALGPLTVGFEELVGLRVNEHVMHSWDIEVTLDPTATLPARSANFVVDNLDLVARFTAKPTGEERTIVVRTTEPDRSFTIELTPETVTMSATDVVEGADLELPADAFARAVYGRTKADEEATELRAIYPGP